jgi:RNA polymerase sigma-70 factor (ECF subfamily)
LGTENDKKLVEDALRGDENAFRSLLEKYEHAVYSICLRMVRNREDARDLAQDAFVRVFRMLRKYDPRYAFSTWLYKITSNLCIDYLRKRRLPLVALDEPLSGKEGEFQRQVESPGANPEEKLMKVEAVKMLEDAIQALPPHYRLMILLRHQEELSYEEIAATLEVPIGTVKARIHRARSMLRSILEEMDD